MTTKVFNGQVMRAWDEWEATTGEDANNPDDFVAWAMEHKRLLPQLQDVRRLLRRQVTSVLRQAMRTDANGITYRAKQCVSIAEEGVQLTLYFDTDHGGTPSLRQKAVRQRRDAVSHHVYRALCDVEHMNSVFPDDPQLSFLLDFAEDCAELRAAELMARDDDDDQAATG